MELAKKAFLVGFLTFERDWNPIGVDDSALYEDLRDVVKDFYLLGVKDRCAKHLQPATNADNFAVITKMMLVQFVTSSVLGFCQS